jgi:hypothetical protein
MSVISRWRDPWPGFAIDVFNDGLDASISGIQMRRQGAAEWGDNWLGERAFWQERSMIYETSGCLRAMEGIQRLFGVKLKPHRDCIPDGMGRAFFQTLPDGEGHYAFRVTLKGTSQAIEGSAFLSFQHTYPYTWTPGRGPIEVSLVPHDAGSSLIVDDVMIWRPDIGEIPLLAASSSGVPFLVDDPVQERYPGVILGE